MSRKLTPEETKRAIREVSQRYLDCIDGISGEDLQTVLKDMIMASCGFAAEEPKP